jgi:FMN phosphatase YigB (HAD superfamily)
MEASPIELACFDVFDTALTRTAGAPESVFLMLGRLLTRRGLVSCTPEAFAHARATAATRAYRNQGPHRASVRLANIYQEVGIALHLEPAQLKMVMGLEQQLEARLLRPVPTTCQSIREARQQGRRIAFVSDMYLSGRYIRQQLKRHGLWQQGDQCHVSCEEQEEKGTGTLFNKILRHEGLAPESVIHHGNDRHCDLEGARKAGIKAVHLDVANLNRYEQQLDGQGPASEGLAAAMAGASRMARLRVSAKSEHERSLRDVTAGVAAPTLAGYVLWILKRAESLHLQRLYFVSRDGQVLLDMARQLQPRLGLSIELRYLYGSRKAWNLAAISEITEQRLDWVWDFTDFVSLRTLLAPLNLHPAEIGPSLESCGFSKQDWSRNLIHQERLLLKKHILSDTSIHKAILAKALEQRHILLRYFSQEGLLDSIPSAMVDIGWRGSMYYSLIDLLRIASQQPPTGFYFGMLGSNIDWGPHRPESYFCNDQEKTGWLGIPGGRHLQMLGDQHMPSRGLVLMAEIFCFADHGTVIGYQEKGGEVKPILRGETNQPVIDWGLPLIRQTIRCFIENLELDPELINPWGDVRQPIAGLLKTFWRQPTLAEAQSWGRCPYDDGLGKTQTLWCQLALPYGWGHVLTAFWQQRFKPHRLIWFEGAMELTPPAIRFCLFGAYRTRQGLSKIKRFVRCLFTSGRH